MKEVKLNNGYARVKIENNRELEVVYYNGMYDLLIRGYDRTLLIGTLCQDKKRLSTINKYSEKYGVKFVA